MSGEICARSPFSRSGRAKDRLVKASSAVSEAELTGRYTPLSLMALVRSVFVHSLGGLADTKLTTQFEFIGVITISFDIKCYRRFRYLTVRDSGGVGGGSYVFIIARLQAVGGNGFSDGERVSKGRHVGYGCDRYRLKMYEPNPISELGLLNR